MRLVMSAELKTEIINAPPFTIIAFFYAANTKLCRYLCDNAWCCQFIPEI